MPLSVSFQPYRWSGSIMYTRCNDVYSSIEKTNTDLCWHTIQRIDYIMQWRCGLMITTNFWQHWSKTILAANKEQVEAILDIESLTVPKTRNLKCHLNHHNCMSKNSQPTPVISSHHKNCTNPLHADIDHKLSWYIYMYNVGGWVCVCMLARLFMIFNCCSCV